MKHRILSFGLYSLVFFLGGVLSLYAQQTVDFDQIPLSFEEAADEWQTDEEKATSPFHRQRFSDTYAEMIARGQLYDVARQMVSLFDAADWGNHEPVQEKILNRLRLFLEALRTALRVEGIDGPLDTTEEQNIFLSTLNDNEFGLMSLGIQTMEDANNNAVSGYFDQTEDAFLLYEYVVGGESEMVRLLLNEAQVRQWRLFEDALTNLVYDQVKLIAKENVLELKAAVDRWENYIEKGYSQMPWEALFNGMTIALPKRDFGPPDHQWILLHPTVGLEFSVDPADEARVKEALFIEALGHIWYRGQKLESFWGISAAVSLREDLDPGIGVLVHFKRHWNLGIAWHDVDDDPFVFVSVDLFNFAKQTAPKYLERYNGVQATAKLHSMQN